jgi:hypothetical protein
MIDPPSLGSQSQFVGSIFIIICLLGAVVGVRPSRSSRSTSRKTGQMEYEDSQETEVLQRKPTLRGHHYSCDPFSDHVLKVGTGVYCAGCTGLTTGAIIAILGSISYFFLGYVFFNGHLVFWSGFSGVLVGLVQLECHFCLGSVLSSCRSKSDSRISRSGYLHPLCHSALDSQQNHDVKGGT